MKESDHVSKSWSRSWSTYRPLAVCTDMIISSASWVSAVRAVSLYVIFGPVFMRLCGSCAFPCLRLNRTESDRRIKKILQVLNSFTLQIITEIRSNKKKICEAYRTHGGGNVFG
jgi:hypothetical protein